MNECNAHKMHWLQTRPVAEFTRTTALNSKGQYYGQLLWTTPIKLPLAAVKCCRLAIDRRLHVSILLHIALLNCVLLAVKINEWRFLSSRWQSLKVLLPLSSYQRLFRLQSGTEKIAIVFIRLIVKWSFRSWQDVTKKTLTEHLRRHKWRQWLR